MRTDRNLEWLTKDFVLECFEYKHGNLVWKDRPAHHFKNECYRRVFYSRQVGTVAGTIVNGYVMVNFSRKRIAVHRIIFLMHHDYLPQEIDHINGDPLDNRIENLRHATHEQNSRNRKIYSSNTSGVRGVSYHKKSGKWAVGIRSNGKWKSLGLLKNLEDAALKRKNAEAEFYGEYSRG